jgi:hypothetical protein
MIAAVVQTARLRAAVRARVAGVASARSVVADAVHVAVARAFLCGARVMRGGGNGRRRRRRSIERQEQDTMRRNKRREKRKKY